MIYINELGGQVLRVVTLEDKLPYTMFFPTGIQIIKLDCYPEGSSIFIS